MQQQVQQMPEEVSSQTMQMKEPGKKGKWWLWLLLIVVAILVGIGIYFWLS